MQESNSRKREIVTIVTLLLVISGVIVGVVASTHRPATTPVAALEQSTTAAGSTAVDDTTPNAATTVDSASASSGTSTYKDGTYKASGSYNSPGGFETIAVSMTLKDGVVTDTSATSEPTDSEAAEYQNAFLRGYKSQVVGKSIDSIHLSRVSGSSLTSQGFNEAVDAIQQQAHA